MSRKTIIPTEGATSFITEMSLTMIYVSITPTIYEYGVKIANPPSKLNKHKYRF